MNKYILLSLLLILAFGQGCQKELQTEIEYSAYPFASLDANGGTWKPNLIQTPEDITLAAPEDISSAAYQQELAALRTLANSATGSQKDIAGYWGNNPILRWNEIALELAAKYNLIPPPNPDGTYTLPDPANPGKFPYFPFAHPPYTSRMLAYLSTAQYDALITAWHYKFKHGRPAPYKTDPAIQHAYEDNGLPSYPSDGAVIASVSQAILGAMFPLEKEYLAERAAEHLSSLGWAGEAVQSDIDAGVSIGTAMSKIALARAVTDGMGKAQAPRPVADSIKAAAKAKYGWQWDNMESPVRPVGLTPLFGNVKTWNLPSVELTRPPVPPAPGSPEFEAAAKELKEIQENLTTEQRKIANWWSDGLGTYTPPGHWNRFAKELVIKYRLNPLRSARTMAYMNQAIQDAGISCWDAKYHYHYPRPIQAIPGFKTILGTPNFPAYTSGHSTFSAAAAEVLSALFPEEAPVCRAWAEEAAESRIYGGIHYRFDSEAGLAQGKAVAQYTVDRMNADGAN